MTALILCALLTLEAGTCGHIRRDFFDTLEACERQRDALAQQRGVAYAYCRPTTKWDTK